MSGTKSAGRLLGWGSVLLVLQGCSQEPVQGDEQAGSPQVTNRLAVPPDVVNNLGITFEAATRGRLGLWRQVPGELVVPDRSQWVLRAPARGRVVSTASRWTAVDAGEVLVTLASPEVRGSQGRIALAERTLAQAEIEFEAARERLVESEEHLVEARAFEGESREHLDELETLNRQGNPLAARELIEVRRKVTEASGGRLEAAIKRDEISSRVAQKRLEADQASLKLMEELSALAVLTGRSVDELTQETPDGPAWSGIEHLTIRAVAPGVVFEVMATRGEVVDADVPLLTVFDTRELRFLGHIPEGDLGSLQGGNPVRLDFPSRAMASIETQLAEPIPFADAGTRMLRVEAEVSNHDGLLAHGISVMAHVLVEPGTSDEVLIPARCVVFDGLEAIVFKRDPNDPNVVIRTPIELGARSAGRVEVLAGMLEGDQLVADGIHQLKQTGLGKAPEGGHFHADGTWHSDHE